ncbi:hypothetical protein [Methanosarcina mazei]|jgi:hypothetical protein|uniref:Uncharacterized protein n=1 Tax=Methanosarcina mazei TaxID=2209 RepID=A0A0F8Q7R5_METMZ|nr:hypothetical protein [Methanosarcina mazei]KKG03917.1 hypothetical protein DU40_14375 [Methanosarcina mazei]KKG07681.1 hypothetical protein DU31_10465 [Methanosarcina mazei]KKG13196.1 hypothetical protein DU34_05400 [Methanosarcina mazei]KKG53927.1 hypothetical protein DU33_05230 [Methanosarcina mazei]KKG60079.1 hypothetical protein DU45_13195 [Methanosarcina mazei]
MYEHSFLQENTLFPVDVPVRSPQIPLYPYRDIMSETDHKGKKKIQCWINQDVWDLIESLGYTSPTVAVTDAFNKINQDSFSPVYRSFGRC